MRKTLKKIFTKPKVEYRKIYSNHKCEFEIRYLDKNPKIVVRALGLEDEKEIIRMRNDKVGESLKKQIIDGDKCVGAFIENELVGHAVGKLPPGKLSYYVLKKSALIHFVEVSEKYRGNNIYAMLIEKIMADIFTETKINEVYISTSINNFASSKGIEKTSCKFVKEHKFLVWNRFIFGKFVI